MKILSVFLVFTTLLLAVGCKGGDSAPGSDSAIDAQLQKDFDTGHEAKSWLQAPNHILVSFEKPAAQKVVQDLLDMGATQVKATDILEMGETTAAESLVVELPSDPAKRKAIFDWNVKRLANTQHTPETDTGQKLLQLAFSI